MKNKLMFIDELLERIECAAHGVDPIDIQTARMYCLELIVERQSKTTEEWLRELPEVFRDRALDQYNHRRGVEQASMVDALLGFEVWMDTREGHAFWEAVTSHYQQGTPLPTLPEA